MRILAVDTSTQIGAVGFLDTASGAFAEVNISIGQTHSQRLLGCIDYVLGVVECPLSNVDVLAVSNGPGSFTGLRIGISIMQGLALAEGKRLTPFSSLEALAYNYAGYPDLICPMIDAKRGEVFTGLFRFDGAKLLREAPEQAVPASVIAELASREKTVFLGDGARACEDAIKRCMKAECKIAPEHLSHHRGVSMAHLVVETKSDDQAIDPGDIRPRYLRKSNAELAKEMVSDLQPVGPH
ncbi:MAG: tRNA (adenosine(37)-N6)-threonylcarbamoyltransferase complex dimerization subunit type 1 TsaB [Candidatus Coatesbacteria bacterium]|nr:tRNA (adenosine(37)-N6)-threonylcarbamoyltransferase complex dimerization subunit type 1 TsaB [Candidatus Coatesbacteria bacterium]